MRTARKSLDTVTGIALLLGVSTTAALATLALGGLGTMIDDAIAGLTESEATIAAELADLETRLAERRERLAALVLRREMLAAAASEIAS